MKTISSALLNFLLTPPQSGIGRADLISITLPNNTKLNVVFGTNRDIVYSGVTYYCSRFGAWERGAYTNKAEFKASPEAWELRAIIPESVVYPGTATPLMQVVNTGMFSGAVVSVQTLFWPLGGSYTAGISMGTMQLTTGQIGAAKSAGRTSIVWEVSDLTYTLTRPVPPFNIQTGCRHTLFDAGCTLLLANFQSLSVPLDASSTNLYLNLAIPAWSGGGIPFGRLIVAGNIIFMCTQAGTAGGSPPTFNTQRGAVTTDGGAKWTSMNGSYPLGYVLFTSGQNAGLRWTIKDSIITSAPSFNQMQLIKPLPFPIAAGDGVQLIPGCDKTIATCQNVYNNLIHIGATPFVPNPEIAQ